MTGPQVQQQTIPDELFGHLVEFSDRTRDSTAWQAHLAEHGYLLLRGVLDRQQVIAARDEVFCRLEAVDEIAPPAVDGIATGRSSRRELAGDLHRFWKSVNEGPALRAITHGQRLMELMSYVFGESARGHDLMYLRPASVGRSTKLHYDFPFFARRSTHIHTAWIPLGDIPLVDGPLVVVEGSNRFSDLVEPIRTHDYERDHTNTQVQRAAYDEANSTDPVSFARQRRTRLLSANFRAGDLMIFGGFTLHGSLDNCSPHHRVRLSVDVRYQPAVDPCDDERYFGADPLGSNGGGYGDMKGAKPLTEPW